MKTNSEIKNLAVESLTGKWGTSAVTMIVFFVIYFCIYGGIYLGINKEISNLATLVVLPMMWGLAVYFLQVARHKEADMGLLFDGYKDFARIFLTKLLLNIYVCLWALLLIVPGIVKSYSYAMTDFILADEPDLKYNAAIERSMEMMDGHKMELFLLDLSMIGWLILSVLSLGIGYLFLMPYYQTAHAHFYEELKAMEYDEAV